LIRRCLKTFLADTFRHPLISPKEESRFMGSWSIGPAYEESIAHPN
jgi:hypothetical protein